MGKLFGPAMAVVTVGWDVWDHARSETEYRPILKENIRSYFLLVKDTMLNDREMGILGVIMEMEEKVLESLQAGQVEWQNGRMGGIPLGVLPVLGKMKK